MDVHEKIVEIQYEEIKLIEFRAAGSYRGGAGHHQSWDEAGGESSEEDGQMLWYLFDALAEVDEF